MRASCLTIIILIILNIQVYAQEIWTIGPMFHLNFGDKKKSISFALEAAYWNVNAFPHSVDFAIEFDKGKLRFYTEAQTGIGLTGVSFGPVLEFNFNEDKTRVGLQGSCWANYFLGIDYRIRFIDKKKFHCAGLYAKLPFSTSGLDTDGGNGFDWDDWD